MFYKNALRKIRKKGECPFCIPPKNFIIFENPKDYSRWICDGCGEIANEFTLKGIYQVKMADNYERQDAIGVLLIKK